MKILKIFLMLFLIFTFSQNVFADYTGHCDFRIDNALFFNPTKYEPTISFNTATNTATINENVACNSASNNGAIAVYRNNAVLNCNNAFISGRNVARGIGVHTTGAQIVNCRLPSLVQGQKSYDEAIYFNINSAGSAVADSFIWNAENGVVVNKAPDITVQNVEIDSDLFSLTGFRTTNGFVLKGHLSNITLINSKTSNMRQTGLLFDTAFNQNNFTGNISNNVFCSSPADLAATNSSPNTQFLENDVKNNQFDTLSKITWNNPWAQNQKCSTVQPPPPPGSPYNFIAEFFSVTPDPTTGDAPLNVQFLARCQAPPSPELVSCVVEYGDNEQFIFDIQNDCGENNQGRSCGTVLNHEYQAGNFTAIITATDSDGNVVKDFHNINVTGEPLPGPGENCLNLDADEKILKNENVNVSVECLTPLTGNDLINLVFKNISGQIVLQDSVLCKDDSKEFGPFAKTGSYSVQGSDSQNRCNGKDFFSVIDPALTAGIPEIHPAFGLLIALSVLFILRRKALE